MSFRKRTLGWTLGIILACCSRLHADVEADKSLLKRPWFEARTAHFHVYSCGPTQDVARVSARLEQFRSAYAALAGAQSVVSPPIVVMAFPDVETMRPFLPLYNDKPVNLAGFFKHGSDENLIVLTLSGNGGHALDVIFHEYTHLLLRHNDRIWPLWLKEGMAEIYSTFNAGGHILEIGKPVEHHLRLLSQGRWMPLHDLFRVGGDSPEYNEIEHQGVFYAESWLLTQYLFCGDNPARKARFGQLTVLLKQGLSPEAAFVTAFQTTLPAMEKELRAYLARGRFSGIQMTVGLDLSSPQPMSTRPVGRAEASFRLGNELMRLDRLEAAAEFFNEAKRLAPESPLAYEGLGLLAAQRKNNAEAVDLLGQSLQRGSTSFLANYMHARLKFQATASAQDRYKALKPDEAAEIRTELQKSISLTPEFGGAHELLGFFELVQGENLAEAQSQLQRAIQLEPENQWYGISLAQAQIRLKDKDGARRTLEPLCLPNVDPNTRSRAQEMLRSLTRN